MILPTQRAVVLVTTGILVALLPTVFSPRAWPVWAAFLLLTVLALGIDALLLLPRRAVRVRADAPARLHVGTPTDLTLTFEPPAWRVPGQLELLLEANALLEPVARTPLVVARDGARAELSLLALRRGQARLERLWLRSLGPLRLMSRAWDHPLELEIPVVPDVPAVAARAIRFLSIRNALSGIKTERYVGDGSEFESLRTFVPGFDTRSIDWKASARHVKLLCRRFRAERNHQVVLAFDTGHLMGEPLEGLTRLDHAIHSGLVLAYVGLRTGDRVGLCGFDARLRLFLAPQGGIRTFATLQTRTSELDYGSAETNYTLSMMQLSAQLKRRSLVVVFSDFVDSVTAELMLENLDRVARRHLVVFVTSPDPILTRIGSGRPDSLLDLNRAVVAADLARERTAVFRRLAQSGIHVVEAPHDRVGTDLLNRYLEIRRRELV